MKRAIACRAFCHGGGHVIPSGNPQVRDAYASLTYEGVNRNQFAGVSEQEKMLADDVCFDAYRRGVEKHIRRPRLPDDDR